MIKRPPRAVWDQLALVSQVGLTFAGSVLLCLAIGYWIDQWLGTKGVFITLFILLGVAGGGYTVYQQIMEVDFTPAGEEGESGSDPEPK